MKKLLSIIWLAMALLMPSFCEAQTQITGIVVVTNAATNGQNISINGHFRYFTNAVLTNYANQIQVDTNATIGGTTSNLFLAYIIYPEPNTTVWIPQYLTTNIFTNIIGGYTNISTNAVYVPYTNEVAWQSYAGFSLTFSGLTNWAQVTETTTTPTNYYPVRVPVTTMGLYERTNLENGMVTLLNDTNFASTSYFQQSNAQWRTFLGTNTGLSNFILTIGTNCTNFTLMVGNNVTNYVIAASNTLNTNTLWQIANLGTNSSNYAAITLGAVWSNSFAPSTATAPWFNNNHDVYLTNQLGTVRYWAVSNGDSYLYDQNGNNWLYNNTVDGTVVYDRNAFNRLEVDNSVIAGGTTQGGDVFRSATDNVGLQISGINDGVQTYKPITFNVSGQAAVAIGTVTNFFDQEQYIFPGGGGGPSTVDAVTIAANSLTNNGDTLTRHLTVSISTTHPSQTILVQFPGSGLSAQNIVNVQGFTPAANCIASIDLTITRSSLNAYVYSSEFRSVGATSSVDIISGGPVTSFNNGSGWSSTSAFVVVFQSSNTGDLQVITDTVQFAPSSAWSLLLP